MDAFKRLMVISDTQSPFHLPQAIALVVEYIKRFRPEILILNGDIVDFYTASNFKKVGRGPTKLIEEIIITNKEVLDPILAALPKGCKIVWTEGNHEFRLKASIAINAKFLENFPGLDIESCFRMRERGIQYINSMDGNGIYRLTPYLAIMHGCFTSVYAARKYAQEAGMSVVYGHVHKEQYWRETKSLTGESMIAIGSGCLCKDPDFNSMAHYDRGFVAGWVDMNSGMFDLHHKRIAGANNTILFSDYGILQARKTVKGWVVDEAARGHHADISETEGHRKGPLKTTGRAGETPNRAPKR